MNEKFIILTIKNINFSGKWMEFWFTDYEFETKSGGYHLSTKTGNFFDELFKIPEYVHKDGIIGLKTKWKTYDFNMEFQGFDYIEPITIEEAEKLLGRKIIS